MQLFHSRLFSRIIYRNRELYLLKIITLSVAFATSILIILFSSHEFGYDRFHKDSQEIFRVVQRNQNESHTGNRLSNRIPDDVFKSMAATDSLTVSRIKIMKDINVVSNGQRFGDQKVHAVDSTINNIFSFHIVQGSMNEFNNDSSIILSASLVGKYFGKADVTGKKLMLYTLSDTLRYTVAAVYEDFPLNSHEEFQMFIFFDSLRIKSLSFNPNNFGIYGRVKNKGEVDFNLSVIQSGDFVYKLQSLPQIYFGPRVMGEDAQHGDYYSVLIIVSVSCLILFLALTSFINLTMLTLPHRSRELAIKKLAGAGQLKIFNMFLLEATSIVFISLVLGVTILISVTGFIEPLLSINLVPLFIQGSAFLLMTLGSIFLLLVITPLFMTLKFIKATPNRLLSTETITFPRLKRWLTVLQLGVSIFLITSSIVIRRQVNYSLLKEPGRNYDQVVYMSYPKDLTNEGLIAIREGWKKYHPNIIDIIGTSQLPDLINSKELNSEFYLMSVDPVFFDFFNLKNVSGSWFRANDGDSIVVVNEKGKALVPINAKNIRGVVSDISEEFNQPEKAIKFKLAPYFNYNFLCVKVLEVDIRRTVNFLSSFYNGSNPVKVSYMDERFEGWIKYQDKLNALSEVLAIVSGLLSCCAIYALSVSLVRDKIKEIAVHKLFGARSVNITGLLVREFSRRVLIALVLFIPLTYIFVNEFLRNFVYNTKFNWSDPVFPIVYCGLVITILCSIQAWKLNRSDLSAALKNT